MMLDIEGPEAFALLRLACAGQDDLPEAERFASPVHRRFLELLKSREVARVRRGGPDADLAVLVRNVLRQESVQRGLMPDAVSVPIGERIAFARDPGFQARFGLAGRDDANGAVVSAFPWKPDWLVDIPAIGVDGAAAGTQERRRIRPVPGDPFLSQVGTFSEYQSEAQKRAVRSCLMAPPGSTSVVLLATGEGKSLVGQLVSRLPLDAHSSSAVTVVIVPTTALAIDQESQIARLFKEGQGSHPRAYVGGPGNEQLREHIRNKIRDGTQGLVFTSPEQACTGLVPVLTEAARAGLFKALVMDEGHLIDTWGANFRPEFQQLAGYRREWLACAPDDRALRTIVLSATVTARVLDTIKTFFGVGPDGTPCPFAIVGGPSLRPEPEYWIARAHTNDEQTHRVLEAIDHLPRPLILYVTQVAHVNQWVNRLREHGYRRILGMSSRSRERERRELLDKWRDQQIDIAVGTAAFGLGIDYRHVRAIVHACLPESIDRYYQEVGRGGRDGKSTAVVLVPWIRRPARLGAAHGPGQDGQSQSDDLGGVVQAGRAPSDDALIALGISAPKLLTIERGLDRWRAMFRRKGSRLTEDGPETYPMRVDVPPAVTSADLDMVNDANKAWNIRTLILMERAGLITLGGPWYPSRQPAAERHDWQLVTINQAGHLDEQTWRTSVEPERAVAEHDALEGLRAMRRVADGTALPCLATVLSEAYQLPGDDAPLLQRSGVVLPAKSCGGCPDCRRTGSEVVANRPRVSSYAWRGSKVRADITALLPRKHVAVEMPDVLDVFQEHGFHRRIARLIDSGFTNILVDEGSRITPDFGRLAQTRAFVERLPDLLPPGNTIWFRIHDGPMEHNILDVLNLSVYYTLLLIGSKVEIGQYPGSPLTDRAPLGFLMTYASFEARF